VYIVDSNEHRWKLFLIRQDPPPCIVRCAQLPAERAQPDVTHDAGGLGTAYRPSLLSVIAYAVQMSGMTIFYITIEYKTDITLRTVCRP